jgi:hypothetical protein
MSAVSSNAVPASTNHVPVVKTDRFTVSLTYEIKKPPIQKEKCKVCSQKPVGPAIGDFRTNFTARANACVAIMHCGS